MIDSTEENISSRCNAPYDEDRKSPDNNTANNNNNNHYNHSFMDSIPSQDVPAELGGRVHGASDAVAHNVDCLHVGDLIAVYTGGSDATRPRWTLGTVERKPYLLDVEMRLWERQREDEDVEGNENDTTHTVLGLEEQGDETCDTQHQKEDKFSSPSKAKPDLDPATAEALRLIQRIGEVKDDLRASKRMAEQLTEHLRERRETILRSIEEVNTYVRESRAVMKATREDVENISDKYWLELKSYRVAPRMVSVLIRAVMLLLSEDEARTWPQMQRVLRDCSFKSRITGYDPDRQLSPERREYILRECVSKPSFRYDRAMQGSVAAGPIYYWVLSQLDASEAQWQRARAEQHKVAQQRELHEVLKEISAQQRRCSEYEELIDDMNAQLRKYRRRINGGMLHTSHATDACSPQQQRLVNSNTATTSATSTATNNSNTVPHSAAISSAFLPSKAHELPMSSLTARYHNSFASRQAKEYLKSAFALWHPQPEPHSVLVFRRDVLCNFGPAQNLSASTPKSSTQTRRSSTGTSMSDRNHDAESRNRINSISAEGHADSAECSFVLYTLREPQIRQLDEALMARQRELARLANTDADERVRLVERENRESERDLFTQADPLPTQQEKHDQPFMSSSSSFMLGRSSHTGTQSDDNDCGRVCDDAVAPANGTTLQAHSSAIAPSLPDAYEEILGKPRLTPGSSLSHLSASTQYAVQRIFSGDQWGSIVQHHRPALSDMLTLETAECLQLDEVDVQLMELHPSVDRLTVRLSVHCRTHSHDPSASCADAADSGGGDACATRLQRCVDRHAYHGMHALYHAYARSVPATETIETDDGPDEEEEVNMDEHANDMEHEAAAAAAAADTSEGYACEHATEEKDDEQLSEEAAYPSLYAASSQQPTEKSSSSSSSSSSSCSSSHTANSTADAPVSLLTKEAPSSVHTMHENHMTDEATGTAPAPAVTAIGEVAAASRCSSDLSASSHLDGSCSENQVCFTGNGWPCILDAHAIAVRAAFHRDAEAAIGLTGQHIRITDVRADEENLVIDYSVFTHDLSPAEVQRRVDQDEFMHMWKLYYRYATREDDSERESEEESGATVPRGRATMTDQTAAATPEPSQLVAPPTSEYTRVFHGYYWDALIAGHTSALHDALSADAADALHLSASDVTVQEMSSQSREHTLTVRLRCALLPSPSPPPAAQPRLVTATALSSSLSSSSSLCVLTTPMRSRNAGLGAGRRWSHASPHAAAQPVRHRDRHGTESMDGVSEAAMQSQLAQSPFRRFWAAHDELVTQHTGATHARVFEGAHWATVQDSVRDILAAAFIQDTMHAMQGCDQGRSCDHRSTHPDDATSNPIIERRRRSPACPHPQTGQSHWGMCSDDSTCPDADEDDAVATAAYSAHANVTHAEKGNEETEPTGHVLSRQPPPAPHVSLRAPHTPTVPLRMTDMNSPRRLSTDAAAAAAAVFVSGLDASADRLLVAYNVVHPTTAPSTALVLCSANQDLLYPRLRALYEQVAHARHVSTRHLVQQFDGAAWARAHSHAAPALQAAFVDDVCAALRLPHSVVCVDRIAATAAPSTGIVVVYSILHEAVAEYAVWYGLGRFDFPAMRAVCREGAPGGDALLSGGAEGRKDGDSTTDAASGEATEGIAESEREKREGESVRDGESAESAREEDEEEQTESAPVRSTSDERAALREQLQEAQDQLEMLHYDEDADWHTDTANELPTNEANGLQHGAVDELPTGAGVESHSDDADELPIDTSADSHDGDADKASVPTRLSAPHTRIFPGDVWGSLLQEEAEKTAVVQAFCREAARALSVPLDAVQVTHVALGSLHVTYRVSYVAHSTTEEECRAVEESMAHVIDGHDFDELIELYRRHRRRQLHEDAGHEAAAAAAAPPVRSPSSPPPPPRDGARHDAGSRSPRIDHEDGSDAAECDAAPNALDRRRRAGDGVVVVVQTFYGPYWPSLLRSEHDVAVRAFREDCARLCGVGAESVHVAGVTVSESKPTYTRFAYHVDELPAWMGFPDEYDDTRDTQDTKHTPHHNHHRVPPHPHDYTPDADTRSRRRSSSSSSSSEKHDAESSSSQQFTCLWSLYRALRDAAATSTAHVVELEGAGWGAVLREAAAALERAFVHDTAAAVHVDPENVTQLVYRLLDTPRPRARRSTSCRLDQDEETKEDEDENEEEEGARAGSTTGVRVSFTLHHPPTLSRRAVNRALRAGAYRAVWELYADTAACQPPVRQLCLRGAGWATVLQRAAPALQAALQGDVARALGLANYDTANDDAAAAAAAAAAADEQSAVEVTALSCTPCGLWAQLTVRGPSSSPPPVIGADDDDDAPSVGEDVGHGVFLAPLDAPGRVRCTLDATWALYARTLARAAQTSSHTLVFEGEECDRVMATAREALESALRQDVAMLHRPVGPAPVPAGEEGEEEEEEKEEEPTRTGLCEQTERTATAAIPRVTGPVRLFSRPGEMRVRLCLTHPASLSTAALTQQLRAGPYDAVWGLYTRVTLPSPSNESRRSTPPTPTPTPTPTLEDDAVASSSSLSSASRVANACSSAAVPTATSRVPTTTSRCTISFEGDGWERTLRRHETQLRDAILHDAHHSLLIPTGAADVPHTPKTDEERADGGGDDTEGKPTLWRHRIHDVRMRYNPTHQTLDVSLDVQHTVAAAADEDGAGYTSGDGVGGEAPTTAASVAQRSYRRVWALYTRAASDSSLSDAAAVPVPLSMARREASGSDGGASSSAVVPLPHCPHGADMAAASSPMSLTDWAATASSSSSSSSLSAAAAADEEEGRSVGGSEMGGDDAEFGELFHRTFYGQAWHAAIRRCCAAVEEAFERDTAAALAVAAEDVTVHTLRVNRAGIEFGYHAYWHAMSEQEEEEEAAAQAAVMDEPSSHILSHRPTRRTSPSSPVILRASSSPLPSPSAEKKETDEKTTTTSRRLTHTPQSHVSRAVVRARSAAYAYPQLWRVYRDATATATAPLPPPPPTAYEAGAPAERAVLSVIAPPLLTTPVTQTHLRRFAGPEWGVVWGMHREELTRALYEDACEALASLRGRPQDGTDRGPHELSEHSPRWAVALASPAMRVGETGATMWEGELLVTWLVHYTASGRLPRRPRQGRRRRRRRMTTTTDHDNDDDDDGSLAAAAGGGGQAEMDSAESAPSEPPDEGEAVDWDATVRGSAVYAAVARALAACACVRSTRLCAATGSRRERRRVFGGLGWAEWRASAGRGAFARRLRRGFVADTADALGTTNDRVQLVGYAWRTGDAGDESATTPHTTNRVCRTPTGVDSPEKETAETAIETAETAIETAEEMAEEEEEEVRLLVRFTVHPTGLTDAAVESTLMRAPYTRVYRLAALTQRPQRCRRHFGGRHWAAVLRAAGVAAVAAAFGRDVLSATAALVGRRAESAQKDTSAAVTAERLCAVTNVTSEDGLVVQYTIHPCPVRPISRVCWGAGDALGREGAETTSAGDSSSGAEDAVEHTEHRRARDGAGPPPFVRHGAAPWALAVMQAVEYFYCPAMWDLYVCQHGRLAASMALVSHRSESDVSAAADADVDADVDAADADVDAVDADVDAVDADVDAVDAADADVDADADAADADAADAAMTGTLERCFDESDWADVMDDASMKVVPEYFRRDVAALLHLSEDDVHVCDCRLGSLHVRYRVRTRGGLSATAVEQRVNAHDFPALMTLYARQKAAACARPSRHGDTGEKPAAAAAAAHRYDGTASDDVDDDDVENEEPAAAAAAWATSPGIPVGVPETEKEDAEDAACEYHELFFQGDAWEWVMAHREVEVRAALVADAREAVAALDETASAGGGRRVDRREPDDFVMGGDTCAHRIHDGVDGRSVHDDDAVQLISVEGLDTALVAVLSIATRPDTRGGGAGAAAVLSAALDAHEFARLWSFYCPPWESPAGVRFFAGKEWPVLAQRCRGAVAAAFAMDVVAALPRQRVEDVKVLTLETTEPRSVPHTRMPSHERHTRSRDRDDGQVNRRTKGCLQEEEAEEAAAAAESHAIRSESYRRSTTVCVKETMVSDTKEATITTTTAEATEATTTTTTTRTRRPTHTTIAAKRDVSAHSSLAAASSNDADSPTAAEPLAQRLCAGLTVEYVIHFCSASAAEVTERLCEAPFAHMQALRRRGASLLRADAEEDKEEEMAKDKEKDEETETERADEEEPSHEAAERADADHGVCAAVPRHGGNERAEEACRDDDATTGTPLVWREDARRADFSRGDDDIAPDDEVDEEEEVDEEDEDGLDENTLTVTLEGAAWEAVLQQQRAAVRRAILADVKESAATLSRTARVTLKGLSAQPLVLRVCLAVALDARLPSPPTPCEREWPPTVPHDGSRWLSRCLSNCPFARVWALYAETVASVEGSVAASTGALSECRDSAVSAAEEADRRREGVVAAAGDGDDNGDDDGDDDDGDDASRADPPPPASHSLSPLRVATAASPVPPCGAKSTAARLGSSSSATCLDAHALFFEGAQWGRVLEAVGLPAMRVAVLTDMQYAFLTIPLVRSVTVGATILSRFDTRAIRIVASSSSAGSCSRGTWAGGTMPPTGSDTSRTDDGLVATKEDDETAIAADPDAHRAGDNVLGMRVRCMVSHPPWVTRPAVVAALVRHSFEHVWHLYAEYAPCTTPLADVSRMRHDPSIHWCRFVGPHWAALRHRGLEHDATFARLSRAFVTDAATALCVRAEAVCVVALTPQSTWRRGGGEEEEDATCMAAAARHLVHYDDPAAEKPVCPSEEEAEEALMVGYRIDWSAVPGSIPTSAGTAPVCARDVHDALHMRHQPFGHVWAIYRQLCLPDTAPRLDEDITPTPMARSPRASASASASPAVSSHPTHWMSHQHIVLDGVGWRYTRRCVGAAAVVSALRHDVTQIFCCPTTALTELSLHMQPTALHAHCVLCVEAGWTAAALRAALQRGSFDALWALYDEPDEEEWSHEHGDGSMRRAAASAAQAAERADDDAHSATLRDAETRTTPPPVAEDMDFMSTPPARRRPSGQPPIVDADVLWVQHVGRGVSSERTTSPPLLLPRRSGDDSPAAAAAAAAAHTFQLCFDGEEWGEVVAMHEDDVAQAVQCEVWAALNRRRAPATPTAAHAEVDGQTPSPTPRWCELAEGAEEGMGCRCIRVSVEPCVLRVTVRVPCVSSAHGSAAWVQEQLRRHGYKNVWDVYLRATSPVSAALTSTNDADEEEEEEEEEKRRSSSRSRAGSHRCVGGAIRTSSSSSSSSLSAAAQHSAPVTPSVDAPTTGEEECESTRHRLSTDEDQSHEAEAPRSDAEDEAHAGCSHSENNDTSSLHAPYAAPFCHHHHHSSSSAFCRTANEDSSLLPLLDNITISNSTDGTDRHANTNSSDGYYPPLPPTSPHDYRSTRPILRCTSHDEMPIGGGTSNADEDDAEEDVDDVVVAAREAAARVAAAEAERCADQVAQAEQQSAAAQLWAQQQRHRAHVESERAEAVAAALLSESRTRCAEMNALAEASEQTERERLIAALAEKEKAVERAARAHEAAEEARRRRTRPLDAVECAAAESSLVYLRRALAEARRERDEYLEQLERYSMPHESMKE